MNDHVKHALDGVAAITAFTSFLGYLPPMASALSIIWLSIQIYEYFRKKLRRR